MYYQDITVLHTCFIISLDLLGIFFVTFIALLCYSGWLFVDDSLTFKDILVIAAQYTISGVRKGEKLEELNISLISEHVSLYCNTRCHQAK